MGNGRSMAGASTTLRRAFDPRGRSRGSPLSTLIRTVCPKEVTFGYCEEVPIKMGGMLGSHGG